MDQLAMQRLAFARRVTSTPGLPADQRLIDAFASTPRERFVGPAPWYRYTRDGYVALPSDDPAVLYDDLVIALKPEAQINNGQPSLHAICLAVLAVQPGERVVHIGAGTGYYTAILATLSGEHGSVDAYEIDAELAAHAAANLAGYPQARVHVESGADAILPSADAIYVNAGATEPLDAWLDALRDRGRLLFPLTGRQGVGAMLLVTRRGEQYPARFVVGAAFIPCIGGRDEEAGERLLAAFERADLASVRSVRRDSVPDETAWHTGRSTWLSTAPVGQDLARDDGPR
jgi:protein-L-isoaspartate(D-aspartate) O-methyltransferase